MRYTAKDANLAFERLAAVYGKSTNWGSQHRQVGVWRLHHGEGGVRVEELNKRGGYDCPFGDLRKGSREFCQMVWDIERGVKLWEDMKNV